MITRRTVLCLGLAQLFSWGVTYYLIGGFGERIAADLGWSRALVHGGFSAALLVMAVASPLAGRLIDRHGGQAVMVAGAILAALGCAPRPHALRPSLLRRLILSRTRHAVHALRRRLRDARADRAAERAVGHVAVTLLGGLASTVFWPVGDALTTHLRWRGALLAYAGLALLTVPLHLTIPDARDAWRRRHVGLVFQDFHLVPGLSIRGNVLVSCWFDAWRADAVLVERAEALLDRCAVPTAGRRVAELSRGEQQRVAVARAILRRPPLVVADEPTASLDAASGARVIELLVEARAAGATLLTVTHDPALIAAMGMVLHLEHGRLERVR